MTKIDTREAIVLTIALLCIVLGVVGLALSATPAAVWVPVGLGILLLVQFEAMRRKSRAGGGS